jgi:hypothetical protein
MRAIALAVAVLLSACASKPKAPPPASELMYPHGTYKHLVKVQIVQPVKNVDLRGFVESRADELKVVGLSNFGTTVFKIDENYKTGELTKEFYVDALKRNEERFMYFYSLLKELLNAPKGKTEFDSQGAHFVLSDPDENKVYRKVAITHPQVNLNIEVTGYEF